MSSDSILAPPLPPPLPPSSPSQQQRQQLHYSAAIIRPTTAGLVNQQPPRFATNLDVPNNQQNLTQVDVQNHRVCNSLSPSPSPVNGTLSSQEFKDELLKKQMKVSSNNQLVDVEDRIKQNQEEGRMFAKRGDYLLPDKLLTAAQREKKPFAYSPDVNDPNNRGKLDLTQIKSPIMRKRLLANMDSNDETVELTSEHVHEEEEDADEREFRQQVAAIKHYQPTSFENYPTTTRQENSNSINHNNYKIQYNGPPKFYNSNNQNLAQSQDCFVNLANEVNKSINGLSQLVSNLGLSSNNHQTTQAPRHYSNTSDSFNTFNKVAPLSRNTTLVNTCKRYNQPRAQSENHNRYMDTSIGDFLLSPDSSYYSSGSLSRSPSNGLDCYHNEPLQSSHRAFRPIQTFATSNPNNVCQQQSSYMNNYDAQLDSLERTARRIESELNDLRNIASLSQKRDNYRHF